jgi:DNA-binding XRE family transcriptional regulator
MHDDADEVGMARAGAAFAARRVELGISQRELAKLKIIGAANLIAFEKGRSWPREMTRARLEQAVKWPPGTLARVHGGRNPPVSGAIDTSSTDDTSAMVSGAVTLAASQILAAADALPDDHDPAFPERVRAVLADLRTLEPITARAVRSSQGSADVVKVLRQVRRRYDDLMTRAAAAPGSTLGQRLYTARTAGALSVAEAAGVLDVTPEVVATAESEREIGEDDRERIEARITDLSG